MEKELTGKPVPTSAMYLGLCNARMQYVTLRWQKAVGFMALNGVVGTVVYQALNSRSSIVMFLLVIVAGIMIYMNMIWSRLTNRANAWIRFYTTALESMENLSSTESSVQVFSDPKYLSRPKDFETDGSTSRRAIRELSVALTGFWITICLAMALLGMYLLGQGKF